MEVNSGQIAFGVNVKQKFLHQPRIAWQDVGIHTI